MDVEEFAQFVNLAGHLVWPLVIILFLIIFRSKINELFGSIKKLRISEVEFELDEREKSFAEHEVTPLNDEIDGLFARIKVLKNDLAELRQEPIDVPILDQNAIKNRILDALKNGAFRWRSAQKLASLSGSDIETVLEILRKDNSVTLGKGKSGRAIAKMNYR
ncbi:MAG: hypothetical protein JXR07_14620 [Reichenbachiella sp.]